MATSKLPPCLLGLSHIWEIEAARGTVSHGRCINCKREFDFLNDIPKNFAIHSDKQMVLARQKYYDTQKIAIWGDGGYNG